MDARINEWMDREPRLLPVRAQDFTKVSNVTNFVFKFKNVVSIFLIT